MSLVDKVNFLYLLAVGCVLHGFADWFLQNDWMAKNKAKRERDFWWLRHPAAYVHAGTHGVIQLFIFPWWAALGIGILHLVIDTRSPLEWWGKFSRQTRPREWMDLPAVVRVPLPASVMDIGMEVGFWRDQVAHVMVITGAAYACTLL